MKRAVVTISYGTHFERMAALTHPTIKAYADRLGADFIVWSDVSGYRVAQYKKMELRGLLEKYDRVLYVDTDLLIREDAPDIFALVPEEQLGALEEGQYFDRRVGMLSFMSLLRMNPDTWDGRYFNTGVMVLSKYHRDVFLRPPVEYDHFKEQTWINVMISQRKVPMFPLPYRFNRMTTLDPILGESWLDAWFLHYAGVQSFVSTEHMIEAIAHATESWRRVAPRYEFRQNVIIVVQGGLASQVAAEPVVRYAREVLYPNDNLAVVSPWSELFSHLQMRVFDRRESIPQFGHYRTRYTRFVPERRDDFARHQVHATTLASLLALGRDLPLEYKTPKLQASSWALDSALQKLRPGDPQRLVLLHPGRSTPPKTFPADVWRSYAEVLASAGYTVAVVGKQMGAEKGVVEFDRSKCIDLVDRLSLEELIALVSHARAIVSNDSGPVQIAGAFETWIGLISTLRHPQHVLPWRRGSQFWRAANLERKPMCNDYVHRPSGGSQPALDACSEARLRECLPEPQTILDFVNSAFADAR